MHPLNIVSKKKWRIFLSAEKIALVLVTFLDTATCLIVILLPFLDVTTSVYHCSGG